MLVLSRWQQYNNYNQARLCFVPCVVPFGLSIFILKGSEKMKKHRELFLLIGYVLLFLLGIAGMIFFIIRIKNYPGQSVPGKDLFGAFVLSPVVMFAGLIMTIKIWQEYPFVSDTAPHKKVKRRLITVLILALLVSAALIALLRSKSSIIIAAILISTSVCALLRLKSPTAFLRACYLTALAATVFVIVLLSTLPSAPGGTLLIVNGWYRTYASHRTADILGMILILAVGPILLAWPLALLAGGLYRVCTWEPYYYSGN